MFRWNATVVSAALCLGIVALPAPGEPSSGTKNNVTGEGSSRPLKAPLTLETAVRWALRQNPDLETFDWELRASDAHILQAGLRPNPTLSVELEDIRLTDAATTGETWGLSAGLSGLPGLSYEGERESGPDSVFGAVEFTMTVSQLIELGGKRAKRVAVAEREKALVRWDYEIARANVLAGVASAFYDVLAAQATVVQQEALLELAQDITRSINVRVDAGKVSPLEGSKAQIALARTERTLQDARHDLEAARIRLAAWWGESQARFGPAEGTLDALKTPPALETMLAALEDNPDLARWPAEVARRESARDLARSQRIVDPELVLGLKSKGLDGGDNRGIGFDSGGSLSFRRGSASPDRDWDNTLILGLSVPLPVFDRNQGNIAAAEANLAKSAAERRAVEVKVKSALATNLERLRRAYDAVNLLDENVLPQAEMVLEKTRRGYQEGKFSYLDVLDAQRTLYDAQSSRLNEVAAYHQARVTIERLTGKNLARWTAGANEKSAPETVEAPQVVEDSNDAR